MKIKIFLSFILLLISSNLATSQVIPQGWGGVYNDNMIPTDPAQNGTSFGYD